MSINNRYCHGCHATRVFMVVQNATHVHSEACSVCGRTVIINKPAGLARTMQVREETHREFERVKNLRWR